MKIASTESRARVIFASVASLLVATVIIGGCSGADSTSPPPGGGQQDVWKSVAGRSWTVSAQTESYECYGVRAATDQYITGFRLASAPASQAEIFLFVTDTAPTLGNSDCELAAHSGHLIYASARGTTPIKFTGGKGVHVAAGQYLLLNIHLDNTTAALASDSTSIEGRVGTASEVTTPMELMLAGKLQFSVPADTATVLIANECLFSTDQHLVAIIPLMHELGTHLLLAVVDQSNNKDTVFNAAFDPAHVIYTSLTPDYLVPAGSQLQATCSYRNTTGHEVDFGESSTDELCFAGIYRYPVATTTAQAFWSCAMGATQDFVGGRS